MEGELIDLASIPKLQNETPDDEIFFDGFQTESIINTINKITNKFYQYDSLSVNDIKLLIKDVSIRLKTDDIYKETIFNDSFIVSNTMTTCEIKKKSTTRDYFRLAKLHNPEDLMFYKRHIPGNMQISFNDRTPSATFSAIGNLTLIGGKSIDEVSVCMARACHKIIHYEKQLDPGSEFFITNINIVNRVCVCSLGRNIDLLQVCDNAIQYGFDALFEQYKFPSVYLKPNGFFSQLNKSLKISVGPKGGVNILGFTNTTEVALLSIILSKIIQPCLRGVSHIKIYDEKTFQQKLKRKRNKNEEWKEKTKTFKRRTSLQPEVHLVDKDLKNALES